MDTNIKKVSLLLLLILIVIPVISAAEPRYFFQQNTRIDLKEFCQQDDGKDCSSAASCTITIRYPNETILITNGSMTNQIKFFNYTLLANQTSIVGEYKAKVVCDDPPASGVDDFVYLINPSGIRPSDQRTGATTRSIWIVFAFGMVMIIGSFLIPSFPVKWSIMIFGIIFFLIAINIVLVTLKDEVVNPDIENLFDFIVAASFYFYFFAFGIIFFIWAISIFNSIKVSKQQKQIAKFNYI